MTEQDELEVSVECLHGYLKGWRVAIREVCSGVWQSTDKLNVERYINALVHS